MADELLEVVIQLESQIQQQLEDERCRAEAWLVGVRAELETRISRAAEERGKAYRRALEGARKQAEREAAALVADVARYCQSLEEIEDETLLKALQCELVKVLPGQSDDHQDVES